MLRINTNIPALQAQRQMAQTAKAISRSLERLSSGRRVNNARDDASGLAVSTGLESQSRGLAQSIAQLNQSYSLLQMADGVLESQGEIIQRMRELAVQASTGTLSSSDRDSLNTELQKLYEEFNRVSSSTQYNGMNLLDGSLSTFSVQAGTDKSNQIEMTMASSKATSIFTKSVGAGTFGTSTTFALGSTTSDFKVGDFNGDGRNDLATFNSTNKQLSLRWGRADGTYESPRTSATMSGAYTMMAAIDLEGDGDNDLVAGAANATTLRVLRNDGGQFSDSSLLTLPTSWTLQNLETGDVDGDGRKDIVVVGKKGISYWVGVYLNQGSGSYSFAASVNVGTLAGLKLGNTDSDQSLEIISAQGVYNYSGGSLSSAGNSGSNVVTAVGDFNGDGFDDLIAQEAVIQVDTPVVTTLYLSDGSGSFSAYATFQEGPEVTFTSAVAFDMNNDGKDELVSFSNDGYRRVRTLNGTTFSITSSQTASATGTLAADINQDGVTDLAYFTNSQLTILPVNTTSTSAADQVSVATQQQAVDLLKILDNSLKNMNAARTTLGSQMNRLEYASNANTLTRENLIQALSQIRDVDVATETAELIRSQILQQAQTSVLGQANLSMQLALQLLRF